MPSFFRTPVENHAENLSIGLRGLKDGNHRFTYVLGNVWLQNRGVKPAGESLEASADVSKVLSGINIRFRISGKVLTACDRCLSEIEIPVEGKLDVQYRMSEIPALGDDDILVIHPEETELNLEKEFHDLLFISLPLKKECSQPGNMPTCDKEVLERMKIEESEANETWNELKKLLE